THVYDEAHEVPAVREPALEEPGRDDVVRQRHYVVVVARRVGVGQQDRKHGHVLVLDERREHSREAR
ncbi:jg22688, partial [Pararge aegeria aegeria]